MTEPISNSNQGSESDRVDRRNEDPLLKLEANLLEEIHELEEAWDRAIDHGYGNTFAISQKLTEKRETLSGLRLIRSQR